jgi:predicted phosphodiesterase
MTETLHRALRWAEGAFDTQAALADAVGMPRTTLLEYLHNGIGDKEYRPEPQDPERLRRLLKEVHAQGYEVGFEEGQQSDPDIPPNEEYRRDGDALHTIRNVGEPVHSAEKAAAFFDVDTDRYYADKIECGQHEVPMKLKRATTMDVEGDERLIREEEGVRVRCYRLSVTWKPHEKRQMAAAFCEEVMEGYEGPAPPDVSLPPEQGLVRTISIPDLHLGNLIWSDSGEMTWDLETGSRQFKRAFLYLLGEAEDEGVTDVVLDVGNDAAHVNGENNQSVNGTGFGQVAPAHHTSEAMARLYMWALETIAERGLRAHAVVVHGNHDWDPADWMGRALWMRYASWEGVEIHRSQDPWQFLQFGTSLLGFTHGKNHEGRKLKAADLYALAAEQDGWSSAGYVEVRTGHTHTRELDTIGGYIEHSGVLIRTSPSLCPPDAFHKKNLYHDALRAAERYDLSPEHGLVEHKPYLPDLVDSNE